MAHSKLLHRSFPFIMMGIPWVYLAVIWKDLPQTIPTHFGISGYPDAWGPRDEILLAPAIFSVMGILLYFVLTNIHTIDPKKKYTAATSAVLSRIAMVLMIFLCAISLFITYWSLKGKVEGLAFFFCALSLFMAYIGNLMYSIKPNYFVGFRLPWTLENEENWRKTHQLASKIWFMGGLILAVMSLILGIKATIFFFISSMFIMILIPTLYSYNLYRQSSK